MENTKCKQDVRSTIRHIWVKSEGKTYPEKEGKVGAEMPTGTPRTKNTKEKGQERKRDEN